VDDKHVVHQRDITVASEQDDIFVIEKGIDEKDKIIFEGIRQVRDGETISSEFMPPAEVLASLKHTAQ
jgi:membrane fusion protein (multidrug efflux system)